MKIPKILFFTLMNLFLVTSVASAGDFDWARDFNISAEADPSGFRARLEARFKLRGMDIEAVLSNTDKPVDAYILFRLGEMSNKSIEYVIEKYKSDKGNGWGMLAKSLGIKPGSKNFHALKQGQDIYIVKKMDKSQSKGKGRRRK